jgi:hypothetical protein
MILKEAYYGLTKGHDLETSSRQRAGKDVAEFSLSLVILQAVSVVAVKYDGELTQPMGRAGGGRSSVPRLRIVGTQCRAWGFQQGGAILYIKHT